MSTTSEQLIASTDKLLGEARLLFLTAKPGEQRCDAKTKIDELLDERLRHMKQRDAVPAAP